MGLERRNLNEQSQLFADLLFELFPEWILHAGLSEFEEPGSLYVDVPSPTHPGHYLQIEHRGDSFEISYGDGTPKGRAEAIFVYREGKELETVRKAIEFIRQIIREQVWLQVSPSAQFLDPGDSQRKIDPHARIYSWLGTFDRAL